MYCGNSDWVSYGLSIVGLSLFVNIVSIDILDGYVVVWLVQRRIP